MAITQAVCDTFKKGLLDGEIDFSSDTTQTFKIALYTSSASLDGTTTAYTTSNEVVGSGYTAGGNTLTISVNPTIDTPRVYIDFADTSWTSASFTARGALIYQGTTDVALAVLDFGEDKTVTTGTFTVQFPNPITTSAIIQIS